MKKVAIMMLISVFTLGAMAMSPLQQDTMKHKKEHKKGKWSKMKKDSLKKDTSKVDTTKKL